MRAITLKQAHIVVQLDKKALFTALLKRTQTGSTRQSL